MPKPEKTKPVKGMAARLRRLEGMVREMIDGEGTVLRRPDAEMQSAATAGQVVQGDRGTTYVGATHFMAMLDDVGLSCFCSTLDAASTSARQTC